MKVMCVNQIVHAQTIFYRCVAGFCVLMCLLLFPKIGWPQESPVHSSTDESEWTVQITITLEDEAADTLAFGTRVGATDGLDSGIDVLNPPPPPNAFDAYFQINHPIFPNLSEDYRSNTATSNTWTLIIAQTNGKNGSITWDASQFPTGDTSVGVLEMRSGDTFLANMLDVDSLNFTGDQTLTIFSEFINQTGIKVTAPDSGEVWIVGFTDSVKWSSNNVKGDVNVKLSLDGGKTFPITLASNVPVDSNGVEIKVPSDTSTTCRVRVESVSDPDVFGVNPDNFIIKEPECTELYSADLSDDWVVDIHDLILLLDCWGTDSTGCDSLACPVKSADLDTSGRVDVFDMIILFNKWGMVVPAAVNAKASAATNSNFLTWQDVTCSEAGFLIERKQGKDGTWVEIADVAKDTESYEDKNVERDVDYYYRVRAYSENRGRFSCYSNEATPSDCVGNIGFFDDFEDGNTDDWHPNDPAKWDVQSNGGNLAYCLRKANYEGDEYSIWGPTLFQNFSLQLDAMATGNKSIFVIFGVQSLNNSTGVSYYLHFTKAGVDLFRSTAPGQGEIIASAPNDYVSDGEFHRVTIDRQFPSIKVRVDGEFLFEVNDDRFSQGYVGVGSRKSRACFDNIEITGLTPCPSVATLAMPCPVEVPKDSTADIPIYVSTSEQIGLAQFVVDYNSNVLSYLDAEVGPDAPGFTITIENPDLPFAPPTSGTNENVLVQISGGGNNTFTGNSKEVLVLHFKAVGDVGSESPLGFDPGEDRTFLTTPDLRDLRGSDLDFQNGCAKVIRGTYEVSGNIRYYNQSRPVSDTEVCLTASDLTLCDVSNSSGEYGIENVPADQYTLTPSKSDDHRGAITGSDAVLVLRRLAFLEDLTQDQGKAADATQDGNVSGSDAVCILRFLAFLPTPNCQIGNWKFDPDSVSLNVTHDIVQDFKSYLLGDVTGDWGASTTSQLAKGRESGAVLQIDRVKATTPQTVHLPMAIKSIARPIYSLVFSIEYDSSKVTFQSLQKSSALEDYTVVVNDQILGKIHVAAAGSQPITSDQDLFDLSFEIREKKTAPGEFIPITFSRSESDDQRLQWIDGGIEVSTHSSVEIPNSFELLQNYPNPFNLETTIRFGVPRLKEANPHVSLEIYNINGQRIRRLVGEEKSPGFYSVNWDGRDDHGIVVSTGLYIYTLLAENAKLSRKLLLLK